jgi:hypothetical protein
MKVDKLIVDVKTEDDCNTPPLQAADLLAYDAGAKT